MITGDTTVARLLDEHPELLEVLAGYHPHFTRLRNRLLRRLMAARVTVAQAAGMAGVSAEELLTVLQQAVGAPAARPQPVPPESVSRSEGGMPPALAAIPDAHRVHLDVREELRRGGEPFARIMAAVKALARDQVLVLRVPFEPIPLYDVLGKRGLAHWTERRAADDWSVWFYRGAISGAKGVEGLPRPPAARHVVLDVRGLEPPNPMLRVLQEIEHLEVGTTLEVRHDRRPVLLYPELDERGFVHETDELEPGLVRILIRRKPA